MYEKHHFLPILNARLASASASIPPFDNKLDQKPRPQTSISLHTYCVNSYLTGLIRFASWILMEILEKSSVVIWFLRIWLEFFSRIRWTRNSYEILQGFWSEFWWPALVSINSDDYWIPKELDDYGIFMKFSILIRILGFDQYGIRNSDRNSWNIISEFCGHLISKNFIRIPWSSNSWRTLIKFWKNFIRFLCSNSRILIKISPEFLIHRTVSYRTDSV